MSMTDITTQLTDKEKAMFGLLDLKLGVALVENGSMNVIRFYDYVAVQCFLSPRNSPVEASLRRCVKAIHDGVNRHTPEFEALIDDFDKRCFVVLTTSLKKDDAGE